MTNEKKEVSLRLPAALVMHLDQLGVSSRSEAAELLLSAGIASAESARLRTQKQSFTLRVSADLRQAVESVASARKLSLQEAAAWLMQRGAETLTSDEQQAAMTATSDQITATVQEVVKSNAAQTHRLAYLMTQAALQSMTAQELMLSLLVVQGVPANEAEQQRRDAQGTAARRLTTKSAEMSDLLRALASQV